MSAFLNRLKNEPVLLIAVVVAIAITVGKVRAGTPLVDLLTEEYALYVVGVVGTATVRPDSLKQRILAG